MYNLRELQEYFLRNRGVGHTRVLHRIGEDVGLVVLNQAHKKNVDQDKFRWVITLAELEKTYGRHDPIVLDNGLICKMIEELLDKDKIIGAMNNRIEMLQEINGTLSVINKGLIETATKLLDDMDELKTTVAIYQMQEEDF